MKGFALTNKGDVLISNHEIQIVEDAELTRQTVQTILSTNKGEWSLNHDEGITFSNILGKNAVKETTQSEQGFENSIKYDNLNEQLSQRLDGNTKSEGE